MYAVGDRNESMVLHSVINELVVAQRCGLSVCNCAYLPVHTDPGSKPEHRHVKPKSRSMRKPLHGKLWIMIMHSPNGP
ncbi:hypothetical protein DESC_590021 [Desulfosarcina cetonica]|nr:hypothetical protein DESC_590021 [Desulfosarcina cetonica]